MFVKKIKDVLLKQLTAGASPEKLTQSLVIGVLIGCCPILGVTTALAFLAGLVWKLNHIVVQTAHYVLYPVQLILIPIYLKLIIEVFNMDHLELNPLKMMEFFKNDPADFFKQYGLVALYAFILWILLSMVAYFILFRALLPVVLRMKLLRKG